MGRRSTGGTRSCLMSGRRRRLLRPLPSEEASGPQSARASRAGPSPCGPQSRPRTFTGEVTQGVRRQHLARNVVVQARCHIAETRCVNHFLLHQRRRRSPTRRIGVLEYSTSVASDSSSTIMMVAAGTERLAVDSGVDDDVASFAWAIQLSIFSRASERAEGSIPKTIAAASTLIRPSWKIPLV